MRHSKAADHHDQGAIEALQAGNMQGMRVQTKAAEAHRAAASLHQGITEMTENLRYSNIRPTLNEGMTMNANDADDIHCMTANRSIDYLAQCLPGLRDWLIRNGKATGSNADTIGDDGTSPGGGGDVYDSPPRRRKSPQELEDEMQEPEGDDGELDRPRRLGGVFGRGSGRHGLSGLRRSLQPPRTWRQGGGRSGNDADCRPG